MTNSWETNQTFAHIAGNFGRGDEIAPIVALDPRLCDALRIATLTTVTQLDYSLDKDPYVELLVELSEEYGLSPDGMQAALVECEARLREQD